MISRAFVSVESVDIFYVFLMNCTGSSG